MYVFYPFGSTASANGNIIALIMHPSTTLSHLTMQSQTIITEQHGSCGTGCHHLCRTIMNLRIMDPTFRLTVTYMMVLQCSTTTTVSNREQYLWQVTCRGETVLRDGSAAVDVRRKVSRLHVFLAVVVMLGTVPSHRWEKTYHHSLGLISIIQMHWDVIKNSRLNANSTNRTGIHSSSYLRIFTLI